LEAAFVASDDGTAFGTYPKISIHGTEHCYETVARNPGRVASVENCEPHTVEAR